MLPLVNINFGECQICCYSECVVGKCSGFDSMPIIMLQCYYHNLVQKYGEISLITIVIDYHNLIQKRNKRKQNQNQNRNKHKSQHKLFQNSLNPLR